MSKDLKWEKHTIVKTDQVDFAIMEPHPGKYLVHCNVYEWSPGIFRQFLQGWGEVVEEFYKASVDELFALIPEEEEKIGKFAVMFGFEPQYEIKYESEAGDPGTLILYRYPVKEVIEGTGENDNG